MCEVDKTFSCSLVQLDGIALLHKLANNFALIVFDNQDLIRLADIHNLRPFIVSPLRV